MRVLIAERALVNLLTANVLWPIVVLPWIATQFARSFTVGHSSGTEGANAARPVRRSPGAAAMPARDEYDDKLDAELRQLDEPRAR